MTRGFEVVDEKFRTYEGEVILPKRSTENSSGYDISTPVDIVVPPHSTSELIMTDIKAYMSENEFLMLVPRSSVGMKKGIMLANTVGIIDADYYSNEDNDGNIGFKLRNVGDDRVVFKRGDRVLQAIFLPYLTVNNEGNLGKRKGGFGSTDK